MIIIASRLIAASRSSPSVSEPAQLYRLYDRGRLLLRRREPVLRVSSRQAPTRSGVVSSRKSPLVAGVSKRVRLVVGSPRKDHRGRRGRLEVIGPSPPPAQNEPNRCNDGLDDDVFDGIGRQHGEENADHGDDELDHELGDVVRVEWRHGGLRVLRPSPSHTRRSFDTDVRAGFDILGESLHFPSPCGVRSAGGFAVPSPNPP